MHKIIPRITAALALTVGTALPAFASEGAVAPCKRDGATSRIGVTWSGPEGQPVSAIKLRLEYHQDQVQLPGGNAEAAKRVGDTAPQAIVVLNQRADGADVLVSKSGAFQPGPLLSLELDRCAGAAAPRAIDFGCTVLECGSSFGRVERCKCGVTAP